MFYFFSFFVFLFGLIIGSFLNCLIWRLHTGESMNGRSKCPRCGKQIEWYDNIPVLSFILLGGKCRHCHKPISVQYPLVELITGILFVVAFVRIYDLGFMIYDYDIFGIFLNHKSEILNLFRDWFIIAVMTIIFIYDLRWYLILDVVTLPACAVVLILNILIQYFECSQSLLCFEWQNLAISGIIGGSFFLLQYLVSRGKWIGGGDIRLGLLMGLALGWPNIIIALFLAYFIGAIASIILIIFGQKKWGSKIPLGIFLSTATVITLFFGSEIIDWYLKTILFY